MIKKIFYRAIPATALLLMTLQLCSCSGKKPGGNVPSQPAVNNAPASVTGKHADLRDAALFMDLSDDILNEYPNKIALRKQPSGGATKTSEGKSASPGLLPIEVLNKWGYIDSKGVIKTEPVFKATYPFTEGYGRVNINDKYGFVDDTGRVVIRARFYSAKYFSEGLAVVGDYVETGDIRYGYINTEGNYVVRPKYEEAHDFHEGLAVVRNGNNYSFIDHNGNPAIEITVAKSKDNDPEIRHPVSDFTHGLAKIEYPDKYVFIDSTGTIVLETDDGHSLPFHEGWASFRFKGKCGYINEEYTEIISPRYRGCGIFTGGLAQVSKDLLYGIIDTSGNMLIEPAFYRISDFSEGLAAAKKDTRSLNGYINLNGEFAIAPGYERAFEFRGGIACVQEADKFGYVNDKGREVIAPVYEDLKGFCGGLAPMKKGSKWGFIDSMGNVVIEPHFEDASFFSGGVAPVMSGGKWGYINKNGEWAMNPIFDHAGLFLCGEADVTLGGKEYVIDESGNRKPLKEILAMRGYDDSYNCNEHCPDKGPGSSLRRFTLKGKYLVIDRDGNTVSDLSKTDSCVFSDDIERVVLDGGKQCDKYENERFDFGGYYGETGFLLTINGEEMYFENGKKGVFQNSVRRYELTDSLTYFKDSDNLYRITDNDGKLIIEDGFKRIDAVSDELLKVSTEDGFGYLKTDGTWLWEPTE